MQRVIKLIATVILAWRRIERRPLEWILRPLFAKSGNKFRFDPYGIYTFHTISVSDDVTLGLRPTLVATRSHIPIGSHVLFDPEVMIFGGNHRFDLFGRFMTTVTDAEKRPQDDRDVTIEDDVWIGARAIILHGTRLVRGAIVAAGAVFTKDVPLYEIVARIPARSMNCRWRVDPFLRNEEVLYPQASRHKRSELEGLLTPN